jgi:ElaB/YqjD/DUF883 family membrane-anchored ribosome-binding protein
MSNDVTSNESHAAGASTHGRIESGASHVKESTHTAVGGAKDKFGSAADKVDSGVGRAADATARGAHRAADKAVEWRDQASGSMDSVRDFLRERPVESVAVALAAGWLMGWIFGPRRH